MQNVSIIEKMYDVFQPDAVKSLYQVNETNIDRLVVFFSVICLRTKTASVQDLPDRNPRCSSCRDIRPLILFVIIFVTNFSEVLSKSIPL